MFQSKQGAAIEITYQDAERVWLDIPLGDQSYVNVIQVSVCRRDLQDAIALWLETDTYASKPLSQAMPSRKYPAAVERALWDIGRVDDLLEIGVHDYETLKPHLDRVSEVLQLLGVHWNKTHPAEDVPHDE